MMNNQEANSEIINVLIVDDHPFFRQGICLYLEPIHDINITAEAGNGDEAVALISENDFDVILMDLQMPESDGITATKRIMELNPDTKILILTSFNSWDKVFMALQSGAAGYILKDAQPEELMAAIRAVAAGGNYFGSEITGEIIEKLSGNKPNGIDSDYSMKKESTGKDLTKEDVQKSDINNNNQDLTEPLTERELEVLQYLGKGLSNKAIAEKLIISEKTIKTHVGNIFSKLQVSTRTEAVVFAIKNGLIK